MPNKIHHTAIVSDGSILDGEQIEIGPYSIIGPNVVIGDNSKVHSHCVIDVTQSFEKIINSLHFQP